MFALIISGHGTNGSYPESQGHITMVLVHDDERDGEAAVTDKNVESWPAEVDLIMSALEAGRHRSDERRDGERVRYQVRAHLHLFSAGPDSPACTLYTRDINTRGLGFITPHRLPLGYGGLIEIPGPDGTIRTLHCTLLRCRQAAPGWYEGSIYFNREQPDFLNV
jgi:hypothetical protein